MSSPPATPGAVFLSYAREDAAAALRIADALRGFGVEVWFDQSELRGGDAWDQKIQRIVAVGPWTLDPGPWTDVFPQPPGTENQEL